MADNPDALAEDALGSSMPVAGLRDWLRGKLPAEPEPGELSRDELGRPAGFEQGGWRVRLSRYDTKGPMLLVMERQEPGVASWCGWWSTSPDASCAAAHARTRRPMGRLLFAMPPGCRACVFALLRQGLRRAGLKAA